MQKQLYPSDIAGSTVEHHIAQHSSKSQMVFITIIIALFSALVALPLIKVDVSVRGAGIVRPNSEKMNVKPLVSSVISDIYFKEGDVVQSGELILRLNAHDIESKIELKKSLQSDNLNFIKDLKRLVQLRESEEGQISLFYSSIYEKEYTSFWESSLELHQQLEKAQEELKRTSTLYNEELVSLQELENRSFTVRSLKSKMRQLLEVKIRTWQAELKRCVDQSKEFNTELVLLEKERSMYEIKSPIDGTLEEFKGVYVGGFIQGGEQIAVISPKTDLIAETYISPRDIGFIRAQNKVKFQIDAFNYNQWGTITGSVVDVSEDFIMMNGQPMFRVKCLLDQTFLELENNHKGLLKKGMTLTARFVVTERSLFQLLFDTVDDWLNPMIVRT